MRTTWSLFAPCSRSTLNRPCASVTERANDLPVESAVVTTAPPSGSFVTLSFSVPRTLCESAGVVAESAATRKATPPLRALTDEGANAVNQAIHFVFRRVATTTDANQSLGHQAQPLHNGCGVEVPVRYEDAAFGERDRHV